MLSRTRTRDVPLPLRLPAAGLAAADWAAGTAAGWAAAGFWLHADGWDKTPLGVIAACSLLFAVLRTRVFVRIVRGASPSGPPPLNWRWGLLSLIQSMGQQPLAAMVFLFEAFLQRETPTFPVLTVAFGGVFVCSQCSGYTAELMTDARRDLRRRTSAEAARDGVSA